MSSPPLHYSHVLNKQCQRDLQFMEQKACNRQIPGHPAESIQCLWKKLRCVQA